MILLADDNDILRITLMRQLAELGYVSHSVSNGSDAVDCAVSGQYKLVLMDISLPVLDGIEATRIIRQHFARISVAHLPIVALSGAAGRELCLKAGMDDFLQKPIQLEDLRLVTEKWAPRNESESVEKMTPALASIIKAKRIECGYSLEEFASAAGVSAGQLSKIENADQNLTIVDLVKLSQALKISPSNLIELAGLHADSDSSNE